MHAQLSFTCINVSNRYVLVSLIDVKLTIAYIKLNHTYLLQANAYAKQAHRYVLTHNMPVTKT